MSQQMIYRYNISVIIIDIYCKEGYDISVKSKNQILYYVIKEF